MPALFTTRIAGWSRCLAAWSWVSMTNLLKTFYPKPAGKAGVKRDTELNADQWKEVTAEFKKIFEAETGRAFPQDSHRANQVGHRSRIQELVWQTRR